MGKDMGARSWGSWWILLMRTGSGVRYEGRREGHQRGPKRKPSGWGIITLMLTSNYWAFTIDVYNRPSLHYLVQFLDQLGDAITASIWWMRMLSKVWKVNSDSHRASVAVLIFKSKSLWFQCLGYSLFIYLLKYYVMDASFWPLKDLKRASK